MGVSCARISFSAAMIAAFLASYSRAEDPPTEPPAEPARVAEAPADNAIPAQTVSTISPVDAPRTLFSHTSYPEAWTAAQQSNRPILLYITMPGCPHCEQMLAKTYHRENIEHLVCESFESIQVNSRSQPALVKALHVKWFPTTILVGTNNKVMDVMEGYVDAKTFQRRLQTGLASAETSTQTR